MHSGDSMAMINVRLEGELEKFVQDFIRAGYAASKTEVIRMGLLKLMGERRGYEDISDDPELEAYLMDVKKGKIKLVSAGKNLDFEKLLKK